MNESINGNEGDDEVVTPKALVFEKASSSYESPPPDDVKEFLINFEDFKTSSRFSFVKSKHVHHDEAVKDARYQSLRNDFIQGKKNFLDDALNGGAITTSRMRAFDVDMKRVLNMREYVKDRYKMLLHSMVSTSSSTSPAKVIKTGSSKEIIVTTTANNVKISILNLVSVATVRKFREEYAIAADQCPGLVFHHYLTESAKTVISLILKEKTNIKSPNEWLSWSYEAVFDDLVAVLEPKRVQQTMNGKLMEAAEKPGPSIYGCESCKMG